MKFYSDFNYIKYYNLKKEGISPTASSRLKVKPYDPKYPAVCMDEKNYQLLENKVEPLP